MRKVRHTENHILGEETSHNNIKGCHQKKKRRIEWHCHSCLTYTLNPPKLIWASFKSYKVVFGRPPPPSRKSLQVRDIRWSFRSIPCTLTDFRERERWCPRETVPIFSQKVSHVLKLEPKLSWFLNILISWFLEARALQLVGLSVTHSGLWHYRKKNNF